MPTPASEIGLHPIHKESGIDKFDVFIAGSGPIGATMARLLVDAGYNVLMTEMGDQDTRVPGSHKKNEIEYQKDIDRFVKVIQASLSLVSIPSSRTVEPTLDPASWTPDDPKKMTILNGRNPLQQDFNNLGDEAVAHCVGGMATHWTCSTPEFLKGLERPLIFNDETKDDDEWKLLYHAARTLIGTSEHEYDESIRHNVVLEALQKDYPTAKPLPLACHRLAKGSPYVQWHAPDNVFGDMFTNPGKTNAQGKKRGYFKLLTNTRCTRFELESKNPNSFQIGFAEVKDLLEDRLNPVKAGPTDFYIQAKTYVVAAGAVCTPQILSNSGFGGNQPLERAAHIIPNLGKYITEQIMAFCQIVLLKTLVDGITTDIEKRPEWWQLAVKNHVDRYGDTDPLPIPFQDPEPQVTIPATMDKRWHTQIHRDAFSYGEVGPKVDPRVVVDLRWFGMQPGVESNIMWFNKRIRDAWGMPQPTFEYLPTPKAAEEAHEMMNDMTNVASKLGGYLPGSYPQFMTPGLALHLGGSVRAGQGADIKTTVASFNSQVWGFTNLYVGGNGVIPTPFGANPTLTSMCLAIRSAYKISQDLASNTFPPALAEDVLTPTPKEWVAWAYDPNDPNYPDHRREVHKSV